MNCDGNGWLVVIDMQHVFGDDASAWAVPRFDEAAERCAQLVEAFGDRVVLTRFVATDRPAGAWTKYYDRWPFALEPVTHPMWQLVPQFANLNFPTVDATTFGKWGPQLAEIAGSADRLVFCGVATDCCVLSTALAAADDGVEVLVVADACAGVDDEAHERALDVMRLYAPLIDVTTEAQLSARADHQGHDGAQ